MFDRRPLVAVLLTFGSSIPSAESFTAMMNYVAKPASDAASQVSSPGEGVHNNIETSIRRDSNV